MDLRTGDDPNDTRPAFTEDVLRIEITGPKEDNLTIIDVPGKWVRPVDEEIHSNAPILGIIETPSPRM